MLCTFYSSIFWVLFTFGSYIFTQVSVLSIQADISLFLMHLREMIDHFFIYSIIASTDITQRSIWAWMIAQQQQQQQQQHMRSPSDGFFFEVNDTPPHALDCFETGEKPDTRLLNKENKLVLRRKIYRKTLLTHHLRPVHFYYYSSKKENQLCYFYQRVKYLYF